jgi:hypothetical protein
MQELTKNNNGQRRTLSFPTTSLAAAAACLGHMHRLRREIEFLAEYSALGVDMATAILAPRVIWSPRPAVSRCRLTTPPAMSCALTPPAPTRGHRQDSGAKRLHRNLPQAGIASERVYEHARPGEVSPTTEEITASPPAAFGRRVPRG